jgi:homoserine acetyltransferase
MLRFVGICLSLIGIATSQYINTVVFPLRKVYISKMISDEHRGSIYNAMSQFGLTETLNKTDNYIRIEYDGYNGGGTSMVAHSHTDGYFKVYDTIIGINRLLDPVMFQCICLHELGHAAGLGHTSEGIMRPIVNYTQNFCYLSDSDYVNLFNV